MFRNRTINVTVTTSICDNCGKNTMKHWSDLDFEECELCGYRNN